jgi:hypothetical protein
MRLVFMVTPIVKCEYIVIKGKQFLDFIIKANRKYDDNIKQIFLILDNSYTNLTSETNDRKILSKNTSDISTN